MDSFVTGAEIPEGILAAECHVACERRIWNEIQVRLKNDSPNEACVFVLTEPSCGVDRVTTILRHPIWPHPGDVRATPHSLEISADYVSRVTDVAIDAGEKTGVALVHTHPRTDFGDGIGAFSPRDNWYEERLFPTLLSGRPLTLGASIVLGTAAHDVDARIWWSNGGAVLSQPVQLIRVVGPEVQFIETRGSIWHDHLDPDVMDRSTRLWGTEGRRLLQNIRVGVAGAGGTGSIALLALATMGTGNIRAWDTDLLCKENLHRMMGASRVQLGVNKVRALEDAVRNTATAEPFIYEPVEGSATSADGLSQLKDCDIVFCCVDKFAPRVPLNDFAYAHLVPVIDMASWIHGDSSGVVDAIMTHAHVWSPGILCAWCRGTLTPARLTREAQGAQRGTEVRFAYGLTAAQTEHVEPSVLALNMAGVGLALLQFMQIAMRITPRTPSDLKLLLPEWELDESDLATEPDCTTEANTGRGDSVAITPTT
jgi:ThiF family protein